MSATRNDIPALIESNRDQADMLHRLEVHLRNMGLGAQADWAMRCRQWADMQASQDDTVRLTSPND